MKKIFYSILLAGLSLQQCAYAFNPDAIERTPYGFSYIVPSLEASDFAKSFAKNLQEQSKLFFLFWSDDRSVAVAYYMTPGWPKKHYYVAYQLDEKAKSATPIALLEISTQSHYMTLLTMSETGLLVSMSKGDGRHDTYGLSWKDGSVLIDLDDSSKSKTKAFKQDELPEFVQLSKEEKSTEQKVD